MEEETTHKKLVFEDNHLLVLNKDAGLLTQPSGTGQNNLEDSAKAWLKARDHKPGNVFLEAIHRLDKPVSGVVVFCKTSKSLSRMNAAIREKQARKVYLAWVEGVVSEERATLEHFLEHGDFHGKVVDSTNPKGKRARLAFRVVKRTSERTLLEIELETGRYHQIRLQMSAWGYPICGDRKYGAKEFYQEGCIALHHWRLTIPHPISRTMMTFEAPPPWFIS